jgi:AraC family transcriptional regulator, melibiose operon regulatory protein
MAQSEPSLGWTAAIRVPVQMSAPHSHDDVEINMLLAGSMEYILNGSRVRLEPHKPIAFWAAIPHELVEAKAAEYLLVTVPFSLFLRWSQSLNLLSTMLMGDALIGEVGTIPIELGERWASDFLSKERSGNRVAAELEVRATLTRLAQRTIGLTLGSENMSAIDLMRRYIAQNYAGEISVESVANAGGMHPNHAMRAFKKVTGATIGDCIRYYRIAHAKRLLASTNLIMPMVAIQAGFGSERRLFDVFRQTVGMSPRQYRSATRVQS